MYYFIINPNSSSGNGQTIWDEVEIILRNKKIDYKTFFSRKKGDISAYAHKLSIDYAPCTLVVVGGDGTLNEAVNGICPGSDITLGFIPTGSGNDFAKALQIPRNPAQALYLVLRTTKPTPVSVGTVVLKNGSRRRFIVSSGIGFDAAICHEVQSSTLKKHLNFYHYGKFTYLAIALKQLAALKPVSLQVRIDQKDTYTFPSVYLTAAMNTCYEGGGFQFCPEADPTDSYLDLCFIESPSKLKAISLLPLLALGKHTSSKGVHILHCRTAEIIAARPLIVHADGEDAGRSSHIKWSLNRDSISMLLPG